MKEVLNLLKTGTEYRIKMLGMRETGKSINSIKNSEMIINTIKRTQRRLLSGLTVATFLFLGGTASGQTPTLTNPTCFEKYDGSIKIDFSSAPNKIGIDSAGSTPNMIVWPGGSSYTFNGLTSKTYKIYVDNGTGPILLNSYQLAGSQLTVSVILKKDVSCFNVADGFIRASGNTTSSTNTALTYKLGTIGFNSSPDFTGLGPATNVLLTVMDNVGCTATTTVTIIQPTQLTFTTTDKDVTCFGLSDGEVTVNGSGGSTPYTYKIGAGSYQTNATFNNLSVNSYSVSIKDDSGCIVNQNVNVLGPVAQIQANLSITNSVCYGLGALSLNPSGGNGTPYTYDFGQTGTFNAISTYNSLVDDTFFIDVKDKKGCLITKDAIIKHSDNTAPVAKTKNIIVDLDNTGNITITPAQVNNGTTDNCAFKLTLDKTKFTCADTGATGNTVTLTATDSNGNSHSATANVRVRDVTAPTALPKYLTKVYLDNNGEFTLTGAMTDSASTDNCSIKSFTIFQNAWNCKHLGLDSGNFEVTDWSNNKSNKIIRVLVLDTTRPAMSVQNVTRYLDSNGADTMSMSDVLLSVTDNNSCSKDIMKVYWAANTDTTFECSNKGVNTLRIYAEDSSGNINYKDIQVTVLDNRIPDSLQVRDTILYLDSFGEAFVSKDSIVLFASDNCGIKDTIMQTKFDCGHLGSNLYTVTVKDASGNSLSKQFEVIVRDTFFPFQIITADSITRYLDTNGADTITLSDVYASALDNCGVSKVYMSDSTFDCKEAGLFNLIVFVEDPSGNVSRDTVKVLLLDTFKPDSLLVRKNYTAYLDAKGKYTIEGDSIILFASDNCSIADTSYSTEVFDCTHVGLNKVYVSVADPSGNTRSDSFELTLFDTLAPIAKVSIDTLYLNSAGSANFTAAQAGANSTDNCGIANITVDKSSFFCNSAGKLEQIIITVTDNNGNVSKDTGNVLILDTLAPVISLKSPIVNLDANGTGNLTIFDVDGGTKDNCSIKRRWMSDSTIDCSNIGAHKIWFYAEDLNGNIDSGLVSVTVNDKIDPILTVKDATIYIDTVGNALLTQVMVVVSISDNCATDQVIISKTLFGLADVGDNNVDITLTDKNGNSVKKTVKVTVVIGDSDNDGIPDYVEKGGDFDKDGTKDYLDEDSDNDGLADKLENNNGATLVDTDTDTRPDYKDLDSDNDGINDVREAGLADADQNGLKDNASDLLFASVDTDLDGIGNQRELDSDNDNIFDLVESLQTYTDANADGIVDGIDTDGDGIIDGADGSVIFGDGNDAVPADTDSDNKADYIDTDSDNDTILDSIEGTVDTDSDTLPNYRDTDSDGDTILDSYEAKDGNNPIDTDNDGKKDYVDTDSDNDLIPDKVEAGANPASPLNSDSDALENYRDIDSDGDKIPDTEEAGADLNNPVDTDSDGKQDYIDLDSDGDTIPDEVEAGADPNNPVDTDSDGDKDYRDLDSDNDGIDDKTEAGTDANNPVDTDGDGIMDFRDTDSDNDEINDATEGLKDSDGNGIPDYRDAEVIIPEAISPNGDGDNDELYIKGLKVFDKAEIIVFNRNGQVVYQSGSGYNNKWDGTYSGSIPSLGKELPEGVYFYVFKYNGQNREPITGNFYIKR